MTDDLIPETERPTCPACGSTPRKIADDLLGVWWCPNDSCGVHQFQGNTND